MLEIIEQYIKNKKEIERLKDELDQEKEKISNAIRSVKDTYWYKKNELEAEERRIIDLLSEQENRIQKEKNKQIEELYQVISRVKRIIRYLELEKTRDLTISDKIETYHNTYIESLGYFYNDEYLKIKVFILSNDKPKNKYTLILLGKTIFYKELLELPYSYGIRGLNDFGFNLRLDLQDLPSIEEIKDYYEKHKDKLIKDFIGSYQKVKQEFIETLKNYRIEDFKEIEEKEE